MVLTNNADEEDSGTDEYSDNSVVRHHGWRRRGRETTALLLTVPTTVLMSAIWLVMLLTKTNGDAYLTYKTEGHRDKPLYAAGGDEHYNYVCIGFDADVVHEASAEATAVAGQRNKGDNSISKLKTTISSISKQRAKL